MYILLPFKFGYRPCGLYDHGSPKDGNRYFDMKVVGPLVCSSQRDGYEDRSVLRFPPGL